MNKSVMKCCICNNENIGRFITINNKKYHLCCIEQLQQENQELKKQLEVGEQQYNDLVEEKEELQEQLSIRALQLEEIKLSKRDYTQENILEMKLTLKENQQKEFIEYLTSYIDLLSNKPDLIEEAEIDILEEILSKYKEILGGKE